jgi:hypothetical protein
VGLPSVGKLVGVKSAELTGAVRPAFGAPWESAGRGHHGSPGVPWVATSPCAGSLDRHGRFVVLNDRDRKTLREVQRQSDAEDPDFSRSFDDGLQQSTYSVQWVYTMPRWVHTTALVTAVALGVLMVVARAPGTALLFAALATMISMVRRRRDDPPGREP